MIALRLRPTYRQFYLLDAGECPLYPDDIEDADIQRGAKAVRFLVAVYSRSEDEVALSIVDGASELKAHEWEHIVEAPLELPSGTLIVATPETFLPDAQRISIEPGSYRVSIASRAAKSAAPEQFAVNFALSAPAPLRVLKDGGLPAA
jgi:hypothetical protein